VLMERRHALRDRYEQREARVEPERIRDDEGRDRKQRVRQDVEQDEQAVMAVYHADGSATSAAISSPKRDRLNRSACRRIAVGSNERSNERSTAETIASANASAAGSSTRTPVSPGFTVSSAPPRASATTGRPHACASSGTMP